MLNHKKKIIGSIIYFGIIGAYLFVSINYEIKWGNNVDQWRQTNIRNSPIVYITKTGERYHNHYHYINRNRSISLFEADKKGLTPCGTCDPPIAKKFPAKPIAPEFYFRHWILMSIIFSYVYLVLYGLIIEKR